MSKKRAYRSIAMKNVNLNGIIAELAEGETWVGLDIAKEEVVVVIRDNSGAFGRPWKVKLPLEARQLADLLLKVSSDRKMVVAMESTGTYGDALRQVMLDAKLDVHQVSGKACSDYSEVFDGVPSSHDGKDAAIIAELASIGKSWPWPLKEREEWEAAMGCQVAWMDTQQDIKQLWLGKLEALVARHWPEATRILALTSMTLLRVLAHYGGPRGLAKASGAEQQLRKWGGPFLAAAKIKRLVESGETTIGMRMDRATAEMIKRFAQEALQAEKEIAAVKRFLKELTEKDAHLKQQAEIVGTTTACVLHSIFGNPLRYHCGEAYRKAMGLNLKERSSGKYKGKLKITKRGPSMGRRWLYFAAMRLIQTPALKGWYEAKKHKNKEKALIVIVAMMRKLPLVLHAVARGEPFDINRVFPGRPLAQCR